MDDELEMKRIAARKAILNFDRAVTKLERCLMRNLSEKTAKDNYEKQRAKLFFEIVGIKPDCDDVKAMQY